MRQYVAFLIGAIIFFAVGTIFAYLDILFQDIYTDNENDGRGFWITVSLIVISIAAIIIIHYLFAKGGTSAKSQFINVHAHETSALRLSEPSTTEAVLGSSAIQVGV